MGYNAVVWTIHGCMYRGILWKGQCNRMRFKDVMYNKFRVYWHDQNLTKNKEDAKWRHGRAWINIEGVNSFRLEWAFLNYAINGTAAEIDLNSEDGYHGIMFSFRVYKLFSLHFAISNVGPFKKYMPGKWVDSYSNPGEKWFMHIQRNIGVRFFDQKIRISIWEYPMEWNRDDPWWWKFTIDYMDILFGKQKFSSKEHEYGKVTIHMPERDYIADCKIVDCEWKRPRWITKRITRVNLDMDNDPIPEPGKGENSWDIDDDATYSASIPILNGESVPEIVNKLEQDIIRRRTRYGGKNWRPEGHSYLNIKRSC